MATQIQTQVHLAEANPAEWRRTQLRQSILSYRAGVALALDTMSMAPRGSEELSAARKNYFFNLGSALRCEDLLGEPC